MARQKAISATFPVELLSEIDTVARFDSEISYQKPNRNGTIIKLIVEALEARRNK